MKSRPYIQRVRAASSEATQRRILETVIELLNTRFRSEIRLDDVAAGAGVSVQTVLNLFGNRAALLDQATTEWLRELRGQRLRAEPGDVAGAIVALLDHYEQFGDLMIRNLAEQVELELIETGRAGHRQWVQRQFAPYMGTLTEKARRTLVDKLVCICDVYTWKLLRRDMGRSRPESEAAILDMVKAIIGGA